MECASLDRIEAVDPDNGTSVPCSTLAMIDGLIISSGRDHPDRQDTDGETHRHDLDLTPERLRIRQAEEMFGLFPRFAGELI